MSKWSVLSAEASSFARGIASLIAVLSVFTAYMFGFTAPMGSGLRTLVDARFIAGALFSLVVFFVGVSALTRLGYSLAVFAAERWGDRLGAIGPFKNSTLLTASVLIFPALLFLPRGFLDTWTSVFFVALVASIAGPLAYLFRYDIQRLRAAANSDDGFRLLVILRYIASVPSFMTMLVAAALFMAVMLGMARFIALSRAHEVCLIIKGDSFKGALFGETENGVFWTSRPLPVLLPRRSDVRDALNYTERSTLDGIRGDCR